MRDLEFVQFQFLSRAQREARARVENAELIINTLSRGQGAIILTGHFGNFATAIAAGAASFPEARGRFYFVRLGDGGLLCPINDGCGACEDKLIRLTLRSMLNSAARITVYDDKDPKPDKVLYDSWVAPSETPSRALARGRLTCVK